MFITLERPDIVTGYSQDKNSQLLHTVAQKPVTINTDAIVSLVEVFDASDNFIGTQINMLSSLYYRVKPTANEILNMITVAKINEDVLKYQGGRIQ